MALKDFLEEASVMKAMKHPNLVQLLGRHDSSEQRLIVSVNTENIRGLSSGGPGHVAQSVAHLTRKSGVLGLIPGLATYFCFSFRFFKKSSCQLLAKVCARSIG